MKRRLFALPLLGTLIIASNVCGGIVAYTSTAVTEEMLFADDPKDWAKPKVIVPPDASELVWFGGVW